MGAFLLKLALGAGGILKKIAELVGRFFAALNAQGWIGLVACLLLVVLLVNEKGETRHWQKQSGAFEKLYRTASAELTRTQAAFKQTVANYRAAAEAARAADKANAARVKAEQSAINERTDHDYQARIADARSRARSLQHNAAPQADPGSSGEAPMPGVPAAAGGSAQAACDRLPDGSLVDAKLCATEQGIQLDELIKWNRRQAAVDVNGGNDAK